MNSNNLFGNCKIWFGESMWKFIFQFDYILLVKRNRPLIHNYVPKIVCDGIIGLNKWSLGAKAPIDLAKLIH